MKEAINTSQNIPPNMRAQEMGIESFQPRPSLGSIIPDASDIDAILGPVDNPYECLGSYERTSDNVVRIGVVSQDQIATDSLMFTLSRKITANPNNRTMASREWEVVAPNSSGDPSDAIIFSEPPSAEDTKAIGEIAEEYVDASLYPRHWLPKSMEYIAGLQFDGEEAALADKRILYEISYRTRNGLELVEDNQAEGWTAWRGRIGEGKINLYRHQMPVYTEDGSLISGTFYKLHVKNSLYIA